MNTASYNNKKEMATHIAELPEDVYNYLTNWLTEKGYASSVHNDEIQAYLSTGLAAKMNHEMLIRYMPAFQQTFKNLVGSTKLDNPLYQFI